MRDRRTEIEAFHLAWLCAYYALYSPNRIPLKGVRPDLASPRSVLFEVKSRHYSVGPSQNSWFPLMVSQVQGYRAAVQELGLEMAWIFVFCQTTGNLMAKLEPITEADILHRDVYVVPWGVEQYASNSQNPGKYYHISVKHLQTSHSFSQKSAGNSALWLAASLDDVVKECFVH
ncbi:MAG: hypothetical protein ABIG95_01130 [Candidatus Woesearchaeota archaeon]